MKENENTQMQLEGKQEATPLNSVDVNFEAMNVNGNWLITNIKRCMH